VTALETICIDRKCLVACSCGEARVHILTKKKTADDRIVQIWSDGCVTGALGIGVSGVGASKSRREQRLDVEAAWLLASEIELYDYAELPKAVQVARRAVRQIVADSRVYFRRTMRGDRLTTVKQGQGRAAEWHRTSGGSWSQPGIDPIIREHQIEDLIYNRKVTR
jgi:hypothetical protein